MSLSRAADWLKWQPIAEFIDMARNCESELRRLIEITDLAAADDRVLEFAAVRQPVAQPNKPEVQCAALSLLFSPLLLAAREVHKPFESEVDVRGSNRKRDTLDNRQLVYEGSQSTRKAHILARLAVFGGEEGKGRQRKRAAR